MGAVFDNNFARFELDYILAALKKPYIAILDGMTSLCTHFPIT